MVRPSSKAGMLAALALVSLMFLGVAMRKKKIRSITSKINADNAEDAESPKQDNGKAGDADTGKEIRTIASEIIADEEIRTITSKINAVKAAFMPSCQEDAESPKRDNGKAPEAKGEASPNSTSSKAEDTESPNGKAPEAKGEASPNSTSSKVAVTVSQAPRAKREAGKPLSNKERKKKEGEAKKKKDEAKARKKREEAEARAEEKRVVDIARTTQQVPAEPPGTSEVTNMNNPLAATISLLPEAQSWAAMAAAAQKARGVKVGDLLFLTDVSTIKRMLQKYSKWPDAFNLFGNYLEGRWMEGKLRSAFVAYTTSENEEEEWFVKCHGDISTDVAEQDRVRAVHKKDGNLCVLTESEVILLPSTVDDIACTTWRNPGPRDMNATKQARRPSSPLLLYGEYQFAAETDEEKEQRLKVLADSEVMDIIELMCS